AIVAALTTSIPESANSGRNWDYRHCWLRDAYFTVNALNRLGATRTMEHFVRFLLNTALNDGVNFLHPLYPITHRASIEEHIATALAGFRGMGPVRVGNAAADQHQYDVFGWVILSAAQLFWDWRVTAMGDVNLYRRLKGIGDMAHEYALAADAGVWEYRGRR